jgi:hypothetical protein
LISVAISSTEIGTTRCIPDSDLLHTLFRYKPLAWLGAFLIATGVAKKAKEQRFDFPHLHQEEPSFLDLNTGLSFCEFSTTGSFSGLPIPLMQSPSGRFDSISFADDCADYCGGWLSFH